VPDQDATRLRQIHGDPIVCTIQDLTPATSSKNFAKATMPPPAWPQS
jgi:hypothetical protein